MEVQRAEQEVLIMPAAVVEPQISVSVVLHSQIVLLLPAAAVEQVAGGVRQEDRVVLQLVRTVVRARAAAVVAAHRWAVAQAALVMGLLPEVQVFQE
jgi:hypothetical protein